MRRRACAYFFGIVLTVAPALAPSGVPAQSDSARAGLAFYLQGRDREALTALEAARRSGELPVLVRLALSDLYFVTGQPAKTRRELEALASETWAPADLPIWIAWLDFTAGRGARAGEALAQLDASEDRSLASRAAFSLGWQLLLRGHLHEAATALAVVEPNAEDPPLTEAARLLRGQALMWSGRCAEAEPILQSVTASNLRPDAARDRAWCHYTTSDKEAARVELEEVVDAGDAGARSRLRVPWPVVMHRGPGAIRQHWIAAYRTRPRGQDPIAFAVASVDRDAAADARALLAVLDDGEPIGSEVSFRGSDVTERSEPDATTPRAGRPHDRAPMTERDHERSLGNPASMPLRFVLAIALLCGLAVVVRRALGCGPLRIRVP